MVALSYIAPNQISITLGSGETMATAGGPTTAVAACTPGLALYDAVMASGLPIQPLAGVTTGLTPYKLTGSVTLGGTLALGTTTMSVAVNGLLRTDNPMLAFGASLPSGVSLLSQYPDPARHGYLLLQVSLASLLGSSTTVPFTLIGVR